MAEILQPSDAGDLLAIMQEAVAEGRPLELLAGSSKRALGRPVAAPQVLDLSRLSGVVSYEPGELYLTAKAATPLAEIERLLDQQGQMLAFEPPDWGPLYGGAPGKGTLGGAVAANLAGSRRFKAGAARDHVLGLSCVTGRGEAIKTGGRVVKNVTGYDLCKLASGSFGTLAAFCEITVKVLPRQEVSRTLQVFGLSGEEALALFSAIRQTTLEASGLAWLPAKLSVERRASAFIRLEGPAPSVALRMERLQALLPAGREAAVVGDDGSLWQGLGALQGYTTGILKDAPLWRIVLPPSAASSIFSGLSNEEQGAVTMDWGGGLMTLAEGSERRDGAATLLASIREAGGHATLLRAGANRRAEAGVFPDLLPAAASLTRRIKQAFDPKSLLNPGRVFPDL